MTSSPAPPVFLSVSIDGRLEPATEWMWTPAGIWIAVDSSHTLESFFAGTSLDGQTEDWMIRAIWDIPHSDTLQWKTIEGKTRSAVISPEDEASSSACKKEALLEAATALRLSSEGKWKTSEIIGWLQYRASKQ